MVSRSNKFKKDLLTVIIGNIIVLTGNIVTGFVVPKILGVTEYGYYKIFTLYLGYISLLHFGFVNGILIEYAGKDYNEIDKEHLRTKSIFFIKMEALISIVISIITSSFLKSHYRYIILLLSIDTFAVNLTSYFQNLSQSTCRFKELSLRKILLSVSKLLLVLLLLSLSKYYIIEKATANYYVTGLVLIDYILTGWYVFTYKDVVFGDRCDILAERVSIIRCFKTGLILMICFQVNHLIFNLDRQFVSILFDTDTYSVYSFAYHLISMVTTIINAVALVLFPILKKKGVDNIITTYPDSIGLISVVALAAFIGFYPFAIIVNMLLPEYVESIEYLRIILPGLALSCCINIIMFTFYKALDKHVQFCITSIIILCVATLTNYIAYYIFKTASSISVASIITLSIWYFSCDMYFIKIYHIKWMKNSLYIILLTASFYFATSLNIHQMASTAVYFIIYVILTILFQGKLILKYIKR